jgi:dienelactone hydrolase
MTTVSRHTGRAEIYALPTRTLSDHEFLTGQDGAKPAVIAGELRLPLSQAQTRFPTVLLVHGSAGVGPNVHRWASELNDIGVAAFLLDCFSGRGIRSTIENQSRLGGLAMIYDAYRALEFVAKCPSVDPTRIAIMGFSKGGFVALYASMRRFQRYFAPKKFEFAAYIPFYARCDIAFTGDENVSARPIRLFHGEADDWIPVGPTTRYVERLKAAGKDVQLTTYPRARHAFDSPHYPPRFWFAAAEISRNCRLGEKDGAIINLDSGKPFTNKDSCVTRGAHVGANRAAYGQALAAVQSFLSELFHLPSRRQ